MSAWFEKGNTAVITGGASGVGLAAARRARDHGMTVTIADRDAEALDAAAAGLRQDRDARGDGRLPPRRAPARRFLRHLYG